MTKLSSWQIVKNRFDSRCWCRTTDDEIDSIDEDCEALLLAIFGKLEM